ncbi:MAG: hypothetical protein U0793_11875 [Gemmataceae bacterium]
METKVHLTAEQLSELRELTQESDPPAALQHAVREFIRYAKRMRLKQLANQVTMEDNWQELERREMDENGQAVAGSD